MFVPQLATYLLGFALCLSPVWAHRHHARANHTLKAGEHPGIHNSQSLVKKASTVLTLKTVMLNAVTVTTNTTTVNPALTLAKTVAAETVDSTALVIARDSTSAYSAYSGLNDRGIPYTVLVVPSGGADLPSLNDTASHGNFGLIVILSEVSYDEGGSIGYQSALTTAQWQKLYDYQVAFGVRMVRLDVVPSADTGTTSLGGCCSGEQLVYISNSTAFSQAGLKTGVNAGLTTSGLWHYPAKITNTSTTVEVAQFAAANSSSDGQSSISTAAVINTIGKRQQMVFFLPFSTDWSVTSNFLQHAWITWGTRGLYAGYRRAYLNTQIDDMFLETTIYDTGLDYRVGTTDLAHHITVMKTINSKLNAGSNWFMEIGHNGNGNIEKSDSTDRTGQLCTPGPIEYPDQVDTALEFMKPLGTGTSIWPSTASTYPNYTSACLTKDSLLKWFQTKSNLNAFAHLSHTFTHEDEDNSTYSDVAKEISWNQGWLAAAGISSATRFSSTGIIPPAITGLHNGDALQAWNDNGIVHVVGDNTRPVLLNTVNEHWPLYTTVTANGYAGIQITPRWATNIYYNCDLSDCTVSEWQATSSGNGDIYALLTIEQNTNVRHLLGLHHEPFMFHQANLRYSGADDYTIGDNDKTMSLFEVWVTVVTNEFLRLVTWPLLTLKHDDIAASFRDRMTRDQCKPGLSWQVNPSSSTITSVTVTATGNTCAAPIPVTVPGNVTDTQGFTTEQVGSDPLTIWVTLSGKPVTFTLSSPVAV